jgi:hypothetical protein
MEHHNSQSSMNVCEYSVVDVCSTDRKGFVVKDYFDIVGRDESVEQKAIV